MNVTRSLILAISGAQAMASCASAAQEVAARFSNKATSGGSAQISRCFCVKFTLKQNVSMLERILIMITCTDRELISFFILVFISLFLPRYAEASTPSFSCAKTNAVEKVICDSEDLAAKDQLLAHFFNAAKNSALGASAYNIVETQRRWLAHRNKNCENLLSEKCIAGSYDDRIFDLAVSNLFSEHDLAIKEIGRQSPKLINIYEAIYAFVTISDPEARTNSIAPLIADAYRETAVVPAVDFAGLHTSAQPQLLYKNIPDARGAASSADTLGTLLWVVSAYGYGERVVPLRIPCSALVKRPEAVVWLIPRWGGAIDGQSPQSDCAETMPSLPSFTALSNKAQNSHTMEGTIRFSVGAESAADYSGVLTQSLRYLHEKNYGQTYETVEIKSFKAENVKLIDDATNELSAYYKKYFNASERAGKQDAHAAISLLLSNLLSGDE